MADTSTTLAPCPFCGGAATEEHRHNHNAVTCGTCGASVPQSDMGYGDAGKLWNRRAPAPASSEPVAAPAGMEPVAYTNGDWSLTAREYRRARQKDPSAFSDMKGAYTAAQVQAMLAQGIAPGWQAVPVEPTREMLDAYLKADGRFHSARSDWAAMLEAAPQPAPSGPARVPLTDEQAEKFASVEYWVHSDSVHTGDVLGVVRAVEAAHGITAAQKVVQHGADT